MPGIITECRILISTDARAVALLGGLFKKEEVNFKGTYEHWLPHLEGQTISKSKPSKPRGSTTRTADSMLVAPDWMG